MDYWMNHVLYMGPILAGLSLVSHFGTPLEHFEKVQWAGAATVVSGVAEYAPLIRWVTVAACCLFVAAYLVFNYRLWKQGHAVSRNKVALLASVGDRETLTRQLQRAWSADVLPDRIRRLFPQPLAAGSTRGQGWFAVSALDGSFVDEVVPELNELTDAAAEVLLDLQGHTRRLVRVDAAEYARLVGSLLAAARARHPEAASALSRIDTLLRNRILGRELPVVWMHGDYKIENVAVDRATRRPLGIIDWELGDPAGLPLIDLEYLLVYNRMLRDGLAFGPACLQHFAGNASDARSARLRDRYVKELGLDAELLAPLRALLVVHAVGARLVYDLSQPPERDELMRLLDAAIEQIAGDAPVHAGGAA